uniref:Uncharacterized protein n=1 Tax=Macaca fascicularis TaxID=9541 RepID=A0A7N9IFM0_MACFA
VLYFKNPIAEEKRKTELIKQNGRVSRFKINKRKTVSFRYTHNKLETLLQQKLPGKTERIQLKYLKITLTKKVKDVYNENYKTLIKKADLVEKSEKPRRLH